MGPSPGRGRAFVAARPAVAPASPLRWAAVVLSILVGEVVMLGPLAVLARFLPPLRSARRVALSASAPADPAAAA
jgi:hypothetical protein